jgi:quercetin dioxygenase-like cupin family protein
MKVYCVLPSAALVLLLSVTVLAQDPVKVAGGNYKVVLENASVRVLKVTVPPGGKTVMHSHPDGFVIPLNTGKVRFTMPDGKSVEAELASDSAIHAPAETHSGTNLSTGPVEALLVELKSKTPGTATLPNTRDNLGMKLLAESPRAVAYRATADPTFHEPAGSKHEFDQVVIALGGSPMSLAIDGKPVKVKWTRGEVEFIPRGVAHESKNTGGKPADFIIVAIK